MEFRLKELRKERKISQLKLALDLCMNQNTISRYENMERQADYKTLIQFADYFDVSIDYLLGRTDVPEVNRGTVPEPTHLIKMAARAGGGIREVALTESQIEALKNLPEVPNLDDKK